MNEIFHRTELLLGSDFMKEIAQKKIVLFGVGGVGSWCAESLIRTGVQQLTIVDSDVVVESNINRQLPATTLTIGKSKVAVLKEHFLTINPAAEITAIQNRYNAESSLSFALHEYDYIIDAIDSVKDKVHLIQTVCNTNATLYSSMGAALKQDPTLIRIAEFWKVKGDPLARALRHQFKKDALPAKNFQCVYSEEKGENQISDRTNGTLMHVTAAFGLILASLVIKDIRGKII
jgi:tRNA A37 threonylcarbamoyladenosine dehydratase